MHAKDVGVVTVVMAVHLIIIRLAVFSRGKNPTHKVTQTIDKRGFQGESKGKNIPVASM